MAPADRDINLTSPLPNHNDGNRELDKAGDSQKHRLWTPEPESCDAEEYTSWGKKHYGEDWYEQRTKMLEERNFLEIVTYDFVYANRQKALRKMEREREKGKVLMKGKTWQELCDWARMHYGEVWYKQRQALDRDRQRAREIQDEDERKKHSLKADKRCVIIREMELQRDEGMLAEGKTWQEMMAWPVGPSDVLPSVEAGGDAVSSPSSSCHSDRSGYSTYPPAPTDFRRQAMDGPQLTDEQRRMGKANWGGAEWMTVRYRLSEAWYEETRMEMTVAIRSSRENEECERRNREEWAAISSPFGYMPENYFKREERKRRMRHLDLRLKGWTQEQIDDMDQKAKAEACKKLEQSLNEEIIEPNIFNRRQTKEQIDARVRNWDARGTSLEERLDFARFFGWDDSIFNRPPTQEEIDATYRAWDFWKVSSERQIELNSKWFGFHNVKPASTKGGAENRVVITTASVTSTTNEGHFSQDSWRKDNKERGAEPKHSTPKHPTQTS